MQDHFNGVFDRLEKQMSDDTRKQGFENMRKLSPTFSSFSSPEKLVANQRNRQVSHDDKDRVLYELVFLKRENGPFTGFAGTLLLLAMRPVLFNLCMSLDRLANNPPETLNVVVAAFYDAVDKWNPEKTNRVAVNLKWKTRKTAMEKFKREQTEREWLHRMALEKQEHVFSYTTEDSTWCDDDVEVKRLRKKLHRLPQLRSLDVEVIVLRLVLESSWQVVGLRTGLKPESARKRCRILKRKLAEIDLFDFLDVDEEGR